MDSRAREIVRIGNAMFDAKRTVDALWQEIALNFYPKRATFTSQRDQGAEYADHLFSSYPAMARRELGNMLAEYLRPDKFFDIHVDDEELDQSDAERAYLERLTGIMWRAMSDPAAQLVVAEGRSDHDFVAFGNCVTEFGLNLAGDGLLFRNHHLRDCAWAENAEGIVDCLHRRWKPTARQLVHHFGRERVSDQVRKALDKDPEKAFECRRVVLPARLYEYKGKFGRRFPFVSLYVECETETVLEEVGLNQFCYVVGRWQTLSDSPYATSMATDVLLPDGRTVQVVMRTLREAAEMHVNPPMVGVTEYIRSDIALYPGGITTADAEYDSQIGDVLRPITRDKSGFPIGREIAEALKEDIRQGFMLDKIQLPETSRAMTATEIRRRIQEWIRAAAPITKPVQRERNHPLCDGVFKLLMEHGAFGPLEDMPPSLAGKEIKFEFRSPLDELAEQNEMETYLDIRDRVILPAAQIDPSVAKIANWHEATRDAMRAGGWKQKWFNPREAVADEQARVEEALQAQQVLGQLGAGADIAERGGKGLAALVEAGQQAQQVAQGAQGAQPGAAPGPHRRRALPPPRSGY